MVSVPRASGVEVVTEPVAVEPPSEDRFAVPIEIPLLYTTTVPVGAAPPGAPLTVTVKVSLFPKMSLDGPETSPLTEPGTMVIGNAAAAEPP